MSRPNYAHASSSSYDRSEPYAQPFGGYADPKPVPVRPLYHESSDDFDEPFDVRADFDGDGPRWSDKHGYSLRDVESYQPVGSHVAPSAHSARQARRESPTKEELVSVPVLGPDWQRSELHELSRRGQAEEKKYARTQKWREWLRDQRGLCGIKWLTRKALVIFLFVLAIATALILYFTIPRPPSFSFYEPQPFTVDNSTVLFSRVPTNFSFTGNLNLLADTSGAYLPTHFSNIEATLYDLDTRKAIATGNYGNHVVAKGQNQPIILPVTFSYSAINTSDTTWNDMYNACGHLWPGSTRPDLKFRLVLKSSIVGLVTQPEASTQLSDITCPFQLPSNSV